MKPIWKGSLSFGLVSIRIRLYSAVQEHVIGFKLLHKKCNEPISYKRWCNHCKKEIEWSDVVKGLKLEDGSYFITTQENLKQLKPHTTDTIDIVEFAAKSQIEAVYLEHHYYMAPEKGNEKAFFLFKKVLEQSGKVAIGNFVMRDKQYICTIDPYQEILLLTTLNYAYEIRPVSQIQDLPKQPALNPAELKLAAQLVNQLTVKKLNLEKYKDTFALQLKNAIKKSKTKQIAPKKQRKEKPAPVKKEKDSSLLAHLRASLVAPGKSGTVAHARGTKK